MIEWLILILTILAFLAAVILSWYFALTSRARVIRLLKIVATWAVGSGLVLFLSWVDLTYAGGDEAMLAGSFIVEVLTVLTVVPSLVALIKPRHRPDQP